MNQASDKIITFWQTLWKWVWSEEPSFISVQSRWKCICCAQAQTNFFLLHTSSKRAGMKRADKTWICLNHSSNVGGKMCCNYPLKWTYCESFPPGFSKGIWASPSHNMLSGKAEWRTRLHWPNTHIARCNPSLKHLSQKNVGEEQGHTEILLIYRLTSYFLYSSLLCNLVKRCVSVWCYWCRDYPDKISLYFCQHSLRVNILISVIFIKEGCAACLLISHRLKSSPTFMHCLHALPSNKDFSQYGSMNHCWWA